MKDIILIQPTTRWSEQITKKHPLTLPIPISLLTISSYIKDDYNVIILDQRIDHNWRKTLKRLLDKNPLFVGIGVMTGKQILFSLEASKIIKKNSNVPVMWGGPHPSLLPKQTLKHPLIDYVIVGEGEITIAKFARALETGKNMKGIKGLGYKHNKNPHVNNERSFLKMNDLPPTPYELIDMNKYLSNKFGCRPIGIPASRGCPNRCAFCYDTTVHNSCWRSFSAERTLAEIDRVVKKYGTK